MNTIHIVTSQNVTLKIELANVGDRFLAAIIDILIKMGVILGIVLLAGIFRSSGVNLTWFWVFVGLVSFMFYSLVFEFFMNGQTPGKRIMNIRVARLDGEQVTFGNLLLRWLFRIADFHILGPMVGIVTIVLTGKNQRVGDLVGGTVLVSSKERTSLENTFYTAIEPGYLPVFSSADQLSAREAEIITEVLNLYHQSDKYELVPVLAERIKELLQVEPNMDDLTFLRTVLKDYNYSGSAVVEAMKQTSDHTSYMPPPPPPVAETKVPDNEGHY